MISDTQLVKESRGSAEAGGSPSFIGWPAWAVLKVNGSLSLIFAVFFYAVYTFTDFVTGLHQYRFSIHFGWETQMPLVPAFSLIYVSIIPAFGLVAFVIRDVQQFIVLFKVAITQTAIAAIFFLLLPVEEGFPASQVEGHFAPIHRFADAVNLTYNELPSLHVAFACTIALVLGQRAGPLGRLVFLCWLVLMFMSTLLTHQHHLLGSVGGLLLSAGVLLTRGKALLNGTTPFGFSFLNPWPAPDAGNAFRRAPHRK